MRFDDKLWEAVKAKAEERGENVTDVAVRAFQAYIAENED